jgi:hypothetical protein
MKNEPYILSASRRMDLPAFQLPAFLQALERGALRVPQPFTGQLQTIALKGPQVAGIVFWTRRPAALLPHLDLLRRHYGERIRVQCTLTGLPRSFEPRAPTADETVAALADLSRQLGPDALSWRMDPIVLSSGTPPGWWRECFDRLAARLAGQVREVVVSWLDLHARTRRNLLPLEAAGLRVFNPTASMRRELLDDLVERAARHGLPLAACCEPEMLEHPAVRPAACLDAAWFETRNGWLPGALGSQPSRPGCACGRNRDIGVYQSCAFGCRYCYANSSPHDQAPADPWPGGSADP